MSCGTAAASDYKVDIGYSALVARLGGATPTGAGVNVAQVEASDTSPDNNTFIPDLSDTNFFDPLPYVLTNRSGGGGFSGHATGAVGGHFYGKRGIAQGIRNIDIWRADDFPSTTSGYLESGLLRRNSPDLPLVQSARVESHAYAGSFGNVAIDTDVLRRFDLVIRRDNVVAIVGTNHNTDAPPPILASAYNAITVGVNPIPRSDLPIPWTSVGPTNFEVAGRSKPDIVVPADDTQIFSSNATAILAGASSLLVETANGISANAQRVETIKAVLLTGATTEEFKVLPQPWTRVNNGSFVEPLDRRFGAGELNIDNSHRILTMPEQEASDSSTVNRFGWDFNAAIPGQTKRYFIDIVGETVTASVTASWLRNIIATPGPNPGDPLVLTPLLANIDIRLFSATDFTTGALIDSSLSPIDNVEHILVEGLGPGRYVIELTTDSPENFALAWDFRAVPEPGTVLLTAMAISGAVALGYRHRRKSRRRLRQEVADADAQE